MSGPPKKVFVIRHCDKPDPDPDGKCLVLLKKFL